MSWTPAEGSALLLPSGPVLHLFAVLNDPKILQGHGALPQVALLNVTTIHENRKYDNTCVFQGGEHPFIQHPSYVNYRDMRLYSAKELVQRVQQALFSVHPKNFVTADVYRMKVGVDASMFTKNAYKNLSL